MLFAQYWNYGLLFKNNQAVDQNGNELKIVENIFSSVQCCFNVTLKIGSYCCFDSCLYIFIWLQNFCGVKPSVCRVHFWSCNRSGFFFFHGCLKIQG